MQLTNNSRYTKLRQILVTILTAILSIFLLIFLLLPLLPPIITIKPIPQPPTQPPTQTPPIESENLHQLSTQELQNLFTNRLSTHQETMNNHRSTIHNSLLNIDSILSGTDYLINHQACRYNKEQLRGVQMHDSSKFLKFVRTLDQGMESLGEEVLVELKRVERAQGRMQREVEGMGEFMEELEVMVMRAMEV